MLRGWMTYLLLQSLVVAQAYCAHRDKMLTPAEMHERGITKGIPFLWHLGMLGDFILISTLAGIIVAKYSAGWRWTQIRSASIAGIAISAVLHLFYLQDPTPGAHVLGDKLTLAGLTHLVYMAAALAILLLFFLCTVASPRAIGVTIGIVIVHMILGTHLLIEVISWWSPIEWYPAGKVVQASTTIAIASLALIFRGQIARQFCRVS